MKTLRWSCCIALIWMAGVCAAADAQAQALIPTPTISELQAKLSEANKSSSSARKKLALKRIVREAQGLLEKNAQAPNRFVLMQVVFRSQQQLVQLDGSQENRNALLETCRKLSAAPDEYAAIRLDADLLLSQVQMAQQGGDLKARGKALRPLVERYFDTEVETKVIKIAMIMALEFGDAALAQHLREVIAQRCPGDHELINFQRDKLAGQVFGAPFVGHFKQSDGKTALFPMDGMGKTTALYFWTKEGDGLEQLKAIAQAWKVIAADPELQANGRYQFVSFNLDGLPDAGESILREVGLDWPAMHLPGGTESDIYKTYVRNTPKLLTMTPTGYTAMVMSGSTRVRPDRGWEGAFKSGLARSWANARYASQVLSLTIGEFLVVEPTGAFDPTMPPEWRATQPLDAGKLTPLKRSVNSVPEDQLQAIQDCFVKAPMRYRTPAEELIANYEKAQSLSKQAIAAHPQAEDLWIVRNRRMIALLGLWKLQGKREHFDSAVEEAKSALQAGYPAGTDIIARFCLAKEALRSEDADPTTVINDFAWADGGEPKAATTDAVASLLALDIANRPLHEKYRRASLDKHGDHPAVWTVTAFYVDRYHRFWMYHPPFTAGWTYGRRMNHFFGAGDPEDAQRTLQLELTTLDGTPYRIPEDLDGKWAMLEFVRSADTNMHLQRYGTFIKERPFEDIQIIYAILNEDAQATRQIVEEKKEEAIRRKRQPNTDPVLLLPGGLDNPVLTKLGILSDDQRPNIAFIRPDGSIATFMSGLTGSKGNTAQSVIELADEHAVEKALAKGDLDEAKRIAFAHAPLEQVRPEDAPRHWKPKKISTTHLRARAKVYMAMEQWQQAYEDIQVVFMAVNRKAGYIVMRTKELDEVEKLRDEIAAALEQASAAR